MADFTAKDVQRLRQATGAGMMDAKRALTETEGDFEKAAAWPVSYTHLTLPTILRV